MSGEVEYKGARFYKCALQVNPYTYKHGYQGGERYDETTYNPKILEYCRKHEIAVVGLADHGNAGSSESLRAHLSRNDIVVFPGFEIASSEKIHMVCLYPETTQIALLNQYLGQLMGENNSQLKEKPTHPSSLSCECIAKKILKSQGGFWYAAHATGTNGLLRLTGAGDNYTTLWGKYELVLAIQIPGPIDGLDVRRGDLMKYKQIIEDKNLDYKRKKKIVVINAKDIAKPEDLAEKSASCLIKMTHASFSAFKDAFNDPVSRIRLNHEVIEEPSTMIESIQWEGAGLFNTQKLVLSPNLNAIIGGRGTGKSTLIESIRFALGLPKSGDGALANDNLKNSSVKLKVCSGSQYKGRYTISCRFGEAPVVKNEDGEISQMTPADLLPGIDLLGQNEILEIEKSKAKQFALLENFLPDTRQFADTINEVQRKLSVNRKNMISAMEESEKLEGKISVADMLKERRKQYQRLGVEEKLNSLALLEREKYIRDRVDGQFTLIEEWTDNFKGLFDLKFLQSDGIKNLPNKEIITNARSGLEQLQTSLNDLVGQVTQKTISAKSAYQTTGKRWKEATDKIRDEMNRVISQLPNQQGKSGKEIGDDYRKITVELESMNLHKKSFENIKKTINTLKSERRTLLEEYRDTAFERYNVRQQRVEQLNNNELAGKINITIVRCGDKSKLEYFLKSLHGIGSEKIKWLDEIEDPVDLMQWSQWITEKSKDKFHQKYYNFGLTDSTIGKLLAIDIPQCLKLEEIELEDSLNIELNVAHDDKENENYVAIEKLSVGQKCTAILNLLLAKGEAPLIIDQPEDHLDNAFIAERIVSELRALKTNRQFLFATHNANIPVFGDAELIAVLENRDFKAIIKHIGSIDDDSIREQATQILEGGKDAFNVRKDRYGF